MLPPHLALADLEAFCLNYEPSDYLPPLTNWGAACGIPPKLWATYMRGRWKRWGNLWRACREQRRVWQEATAREMRSAGRSIADINAVTGMSIGRIAKLRKIG
jgi:hypothetical protein